jgi:hypothetical protein
MRCRNCGYDLRGLIEHRCPECGKEFDPNDKAKMIDGRFSLAWIVFAWLLVIVGRFFATGSERDPLPCILGPIVLIIAIGVVMHAGAALQRRKNLVKHRHAMIAGFVGAIAFFLWLFVGLMVSALGR